MGEKPNQSGLSRRHILQQIKGSLKCLQMDHVDLYQIHRWDYATPIEETLRILDDIVHQGQAYYVGASSMWAWQFLKALNTSDRLGLARFVSMQNHYNLLYREEELEMIPLCKQEGVGLIPWSLLAKGFLSGKYGRGEDAKSVRYESDKLLRERFFKPEDFDVVEAVQTVAKEKDASPAQVAIAWLLHKGVTAPIIGVRNVGQLEDAVGALEVKLSEDDAKRLEAGYKPHAVIGHE